MRELRLEDSHATLRYHDLPGDGLPILFIHGLGCAGSFDYPQVAAQPCLSGHRRILVDLLGSGYSDKPADVDYSIAHHAASLLALVNDLQLSKVVVFGHSMGGAVAIALARLLGDTLHALILSEANLDAGGGFFSRQIAAYSEQAYLQTGHQALVAQNIADGNSLWAASLAQSSPLAIYRNAQSLIAGQTPNWRATLYDLPVAKYFVFGSLSLPDSDVDALAAHGVPVVIIPEVGHSMAWENPAAVATAIHQLIPVA